jgi:glucose uptake protein
MAEGNVPMLALGVGCVMLAIVLDALAYKRLAAAGIWAPLRGIVLAVIAGVLRGIIWSLGMSFSIIASTAAGPALSYGLGQGATLVGALWGVFIWKEFRGAPPGTGWLLAAMFVLYLVGLGVLIASKP